MFELQNQISTQLNQQVENLKRDSISLVVNFFKSYYRVVFSGISDKYVINEININQLNDKIANYFDSNVPLNFKNREFLDYDFEFNEIGFKKNYPDINYNQLSEYNYAFTNLELACMKEMFKVKFHKDNFELLRPNQLISSFEQIENIQLLNRNRVLTYNKGNWFDFIEKTFVSIFREFKFNEKYSTKNLRRFTKEIGNDYLLAIEYSIKNRDLTSSLEDYDYLKMPEFYIVFINKASKVLTQRKYVKSFIDGYLSFGILGNPAFFNFEKCLDSFAFILDDIKTNELKSYNLDAIISLSEIMHFHREIGMESKNYENLILKHAYFKITTLEFSTKPYLSFIENSISRTFNLPSTLHLPDDK